MMVNGGGDDGVCSRCAGVRTVCALDTCWMCIGGRCTGGVLEVCGGNAPLGCVSERWQGTTATSPFGPSPAELVAERPSITLSSGQSSHTRRGTEPDTLT